jgi:hypothetical protein
MEPLAELPVLLLPDRDFETRVRKAEFGRMNGIQRRQPPEHEEGKSGTLYEVRLQHSWILSAWGISSTI